MITMDKIGKKARRNETTQKIQDDCVQKYKGDIHIHQT
jgi:hypothetical protein